MYKSPQNNDKYVWTNHVKEKMAYYRISESLVKRIIRFPKRREDGVATGTTAVMQNSGNSKKLQEVWVMYQEISNKKPASQKLQRGEQVTKNQAKSVILTSSHLSHLSLIVPRKRIISAWRYPGTSPVGKTIPIPDDILQELGHLVD